jgi:signal peptidase I
LFEGLGAATPPERDFIKRVVGLPGETVSIKDSIVTIKTVDGKTLKMDEPYLSPNRDNNPFGPFTVPKESFFLMGDNRANSSDSRTNTFAGLCPSAPCAIPKGRIVGRAFITIWPPGRFRLHHPPKYVALMQPSLGFLLPAL